MSSYPTPPSSFGQMSGGFPSAQSNPAPLLGPSQPVQVPMTSPAPAAPSPEQQSEALMMQIREMTMQIDALSRQFPVAGEDLEIAKQSLINSMTKIVITQSSTESMSAPNLVG